MSFQYRAALDMRATVCVGDLAKLLPQLVETNATAFIIADAVAVKQHQFVHDLLLERKSHFLCRQISESDKTSDTATAIIQELILRKFPKDGYLVALGGGVICDISGFVAMTYRRGIPFVLVPTTLVAQVDAAIGGKNGLNCSRHKNILGGFHYPKATIVDTRFLASLDDLHLICGLAEMIKVFVVSDSTAIQTVLAEVVQDFRLALSMKALVPNAILRKIELLEEDPLEVKSTRLLNFGHAFAHDLEEFSEFTLPHGLAVLIGMVMEIELSKELHLGPLVYLDRLQGCIVRLFRISGARFPSEFDNLEDVIAKTRSARRGSVNWVCPTEPGHAVIVHDVEYGTIQRAWSNIRGTMA